MAPQLFLLATLSLAFLGNCHADLVSDVCSKSINPSLCTQVLTSDPRSRGADLRGLGQIIIEKAKAATSNAISVAKTFDGGKNKGIINVCIETFSDAIDNLNQCSQLLKGGNKSDLKAQGSGALSNAGTCDDEFEGSEPAKLEAASKRAQDLIGVLLVIANSL